MPEAHLRTHLPRGQDTTQPRSYPTRVLRRPCTQQRGRCATQHGIPIGQHQHTLTGQCWVHAGQQDPAGCGQGQRTTQQDDHPRYVQLEQLTVGGGDRTPTHTGHELADAGL